MTFFDILITFLESHTTLAYFILLLGAYSETFIGVGFFIYGEIFFLSGAILAGAGYLNIWLVAFVCILGGWLGDTSSYFVGFIYGKRIIKNFFKKTNRYLSLRNYQRGKRLFHKHGKKTIFLARFMGPLSWITPFIAGTLHVKYKDFIKYNTPGVIGGISLFLAVGYLFGFSYQLILRRVLQGVSYGVVLLLALALYFALSKSGILERFSVYVRETFKRIAR